MVSKFLLVRKSQAGIQNCLETASKSGEWSVVMLTRARLSECVSEL